MVDSRIDKSFEEYNGIQNENVSEPVQKLIKFDAN